MGGLNAARFRYWKRLAFNVIAYALCAYCLSVSFILLQFLEGVFVFCWQVMSVSGNTHNPVCSSLFPSHTIFLL